MEINGYVLVGLILKLATIVALAVFVIPKQWRELNKPHSTITWLRELLFAAITTYLVTRLFPFTYSATYRLFSEPAFDLQNVATVMSDFGNLIFALCFVLIYNSSMRKNS